ncbi:MAG: cold shock domain-containing protein [Pseudomonadota bacterium]
MAMERITGTIKTFDPVEGQGTIARDDGAGEVFLDVFGLQPGDELRIKEGVQVEFRVLAHTTGHRAEDVRILDTGAF